jgi:hypothetical protein
MPKRSSPNKTRTPVVNRFAKSIAGLVIGNPIVEDPLPVKNPSPDVLSRFGGLKGKARGKKRSPKRR